MVQPESCEVADFLVSYSVRDRSETEEIAKFFGISVPEMARRNAALVMSHVLPTGGGTPSQLVTSWDTSTYHKYLWWVLTGEEERAWKGVAGLATAKLVTGDGYSAQGDEGGAFRNLALGLQHMSVVLQRDAATQQLNERFILRTLSLPSDADGICSRVVCNVGGHVGATVRRSVPREKNVPAAVAHRAAVENSRACLRGLAKLSKADAISQLRRRGAQLMAETTPPISRTENHDDAAVPHAFECELEFPIFTILGNLNRAPEVERSIRSSKHGPLASSAPTRSGSAANG